MHSRGEVLAKDKDNIIRCRRWALSSRNRRLRSDLLSVAGLKLLHEKMFDEVWKWAGSFRLTEKNIGILAYQITSQLHNLCEDVKAQLAHQSYHIDECAVRFHHRLTLIHPFRNGNGRHARLACDLLLRFNGAEEFTWGRTNLTEASAVRKA